MAKETKDNTEKQVLLKEVTYQLEHSMGKLKSLLGEKKFASRVKKLPNS